MSELDAIGDLAAGGLVARALEPAHGEGDGHTHETACLNCGEALVGSHCHACGQRGHQHKTLGAFFHDLLHGVLHFEGKTWRTLPLLVLRPGELTRRYIAGERARFVSPMALFLFSVFLMFAVFQMAEFGEESRGEVDAAAPVSADPEQAERQLEALRAMRDGLATDSAAGPVIDQQIEALERRVENDARVARGEPEVLAQSEDGTSRLTVQKTGWGFFDRAIGKWRENPGLMAYKLQSNSYKFSWLLIPLSVPFVWLILAWRRQFGAYDHAVFVTYSLCFMSLLFTTLWVLDWLGVPGFVRFFAFLLIPPVHIYKQLRGAYALSRFSALWRTMVLLVFITIILMVFINVLLVLGTLG